MISARHVPPPPEDSDDLLAELKRIGTPRVPSLGRSENIPTSIREHNATRETVPQTPDRKVRTSGIRSSLFGLLAHMRERSDNYPTIVDDAAAENADRDFRDGFDPDKELDKEG